MEDPEVYDPDHKEFSKLFKSVCDNTLIVIAVLVVIVVFVIVLCVYFNVSVVVYATVTLLLLGSFMTATVLCDNYEGRKHWHNISKTFE